MVAGTIGNDGILMRPYVVEKIVTPNGKTRSRTKPTKIRRAVSPAAARDIGAMMVRAVQAGTGTAAQISGLEIGGKTGTAETGVDGNNTTWFIAFAGDPGQETEARDRRRAPEPVAHRWRDGCANRATGHAGTPDPDGESVTYGIHGRQRHHRDTLRRPLPARAQARLRWDGGRLAGRGSGARTPRRGEDPPRALRERRAVRRALPPRGDPRRRALAPEHRLDLRPWRRRRLVLHRDGVHRGPHAQGADRDARAVPGAGRDLVHPPDPRRAPVRAQERDHPPGHQAAQRARRPRGPGQGRRLRDRARRARAR